MEAKFAIGSKVRLKPKVRVTNIGVGRRLINGVQTVSRISTWQGNPNKYSGKPCYDLQAGYVIPEELLEAVDGE